jgi:hypothetical protein
VKIVGLVSCYREGSLVAAAVASLRHLDFTLVFEGPVEGNPVSGKPSQLPRFDQAEGRVVNGSWDSDAGKRTAMVEWVRSRRYLQDPDGVWGLWLDADEILLWGEYLHDWVARVAEQDADVGGWPLALTELDGSVTICMGKLLRVDRVRRYLASSSYLEFDDGTRKTLGNVPAWTPTGGPQPGVAGWRARPPLQGEPHLLHRPILRSRDRQVERQHLAEERAFADAEIRALMGIDNP